MDPQPNCLFITYVEKEGPFLKVWGQADKNTSLYIEQVLHGFSNQFDNGLCIPHPESLQIGILCCAKYKDNKYYRSRITSLDFLHNRYIEVNFIDYGHKDVVPISNIRSLEGFETSFISIQPQATSFLLAEAVCPRGEWNEAYLDEICKEIRYSEVNFSIVAQVTKHYLVRLFTGVNNLAIILIAKGLMRHTSLTTQEAVLLSMMPRTMPAQQGSTQQNIATYKAFTLEPGSQYEVYVSYVTDGPCNFSIQLKQSEEVLGKLMKEINSMTLTPIEGIPLPGTVCLARCMEDGHICRAVVTNEVDGQYKVFYVDFGNFEVVPLEALYEIPFKYVIPKVMAIRFALAGVEKSTVTLDMQCAFKQFVDNRLIHMKVMPLTARTSLPRCELWDPETQISALDIVNQAASAGFPDAVALHRGFSQPIKVSYVFSCNRFYVQLKARQDELLRLMLDMQVLCRDVDSLANNVVKVGLPCYALYEGDQQWYRSQIVEIVAGGQTKVHYVDYGNEEVVSISQLKPIEGKQLTILRPQAIECCLNGYQNMEPDLERDNLLEELILEQEFTMKVVEMQGKKALIELIDAANYNVASLLLDKIAATRSQVSPMMVQAGNKIEHRKSIQYNSKEQEYKPEQRKPERNRSYDSTESNDNSWRQDNKGFNKNERNKRDELNDSTDSERHSTKGYGKNDRNARNNDGGSWQQNKGFNKNQDRSNRDNNQDRFNKGNNQDRFNKDNNQDRFNRDNNRNNDWNSGNERKFSRNKNDFGGGADRDNRQNFNSGRGDKWDTANDNERPNMNAGKEEWGEAKENEPRHFDKRDRDNAAGGRQNYNSRNRDDWGGGGEGDGKLFNKRDREKWDNKNQENKDDWGGSTENDRPFNKRDKEKWVNKDHDKRSFNSKGDDWGNKEEGRRNFHSKGDDDWGNKGGDRRNFGSKGDRDNEWGGVGKRDKEGWSNEDRKGREDFKTNRNKFDESNNDGWGSKPSYKGDFKKRPDFKRETSELSSSGSEKSFRKGFKNNFQNKGKPSFDRKFDKSPRNDSTGEDPWNVSTSTALEVQNLAPSTATFTLLNVDNTEANVLISWFHNPAHFYCQIENAQDEFKRMMEEIQQAYKGRPPSTAPVGAPVIGLFPEDNVLYRAQVVEILGSQFKVCYIDFGNVSVISKIWPIETRFMELPAQAICCKLSGIEPPSDAWPDASSYSPYFDKKQFLCRFIATENDKVAVLLEHENEEIGNLLLRDGLATSVIPPAELELPLLIGQQFRAMLLSVNSLADFSMSLQSGILLNCSVFNLSESTETWENNLKEKIDQILIVYVDDLKERLEVTLYDETGAKIKLIDKDEGAFETVELLCPYLITNSFLSGEISHVEEETVFIQPSECVQTLESLLNIMYEYYEKTPSENAVTPAENFLYAARGTDSNWYRARVTKIDNQVTVNYVDYGNSEELEITALREITAESMETAAMCVGVTIKDANEDLVGKFVIVNLTFTENGLEGTIQEEQAPVVPEEVPEESQVVPLESEVNELEVPPVQASVSCGTQVVLSHTDSPSDFYLQLAESVESIEQLQATLQEQMLETPDLENPVVGALCGAPYSLDQQWYRAQVLDADTDITTVRFVDYGNTDVLDNSTTSAKTLPPHLLSMEVHATRCTLKIKPIDEEWTSAASERFEQLCSVENLTAQFISQDEKTNYVELYSDGANVREILIGENLALPDEEVMAETSTVGFVSHLNSPSEFWIQLENCVDELEWVAEQLSGAEAFPELEDLAPGTLCAALFPDDQMWYRARILSNTVAGIEVLFVDYGNSCTSCSLRELPEDLVMLPPLAQKCSLQKPESLTNWGPGMIRKFGEVSAEGQTTFNVKKLSTGETAAVELTLNGVDVTTLILPTTEDVRVASCGMLEEMVLIKGDEELEAKYKLESLPDVTWNEESVKKFEEMNNESQTVFQAEFISDDTVRLYLGLNDIRLELNGTKTTTPTSSPMKTRPEKPESDITHSDKDITGDYDDLKHEVEVSVDSVIDHHENQTFVESLVGGMLDNVTNDKTHDVEDMVEGLIESVHDRVFLAGLVNDVVDVLTNQSQNSQVELESEHINEHITNNDTGSETLVASVLTDIIRQSINNDESNSTAVETTYDEVSKTCNQSGDAVSESIVASVSTVLIEQNINNDDAYNTSAEIITTEFSEQCRQRGNAGSESVVASALTDFTEQGSKHGDSAEFFTNEVSTQHNQSGDSGEGATGLTESGNFVKDVLEQAENQTGTEICGEPVSFVIESSEKAENTSNREERVADIESEISDDRVKGDENEDDDRKEEVVAEESVDTSSKQDDTKEEASNLSDIKSDHSPEKIQSDKSEIVEINSERDDTKDEDSNLSDIKSDDSPERTQSDKSDIAEGSNQLDDPIEESQNLSDCQTDKSPNKSESHKSETSEQSNKEEKREDCSDKVSASFKVSDGEEETISSDPTPESEKDIKDISELNTTKKNEKKEDAAHSQSD